MSRQASTPLPTPRRRRRASPAATPSASPSAVPLHVRVPNRSAAAAAGSRGSQRGPSNGRKSSATGGGDTGRSSPRVSPLAESGKPRTFGSGSVVRGVVLSGWYAATAAAPSAPHGLVSPGDEGVSTGNFRLGRLLAEGAHGFVFEAVPCDEFGTDLPVPAPAENDADLVPMRLVAKVGSLDCVANAMEFAWYRRLLMGPEHSEFVGVCARGGGGGGGRTWLYAVPPRVESCP